MFIPILSTGGARKTKSEFLAAALNCNDEVVLEFCSLVNKCFLFCSVFQIFTKLFDHRIAKWVSNIFYNLLQICCLLCLFFTIKTSDLCQIFTSIACFVLKKILKIIKCLSALKVFIHLTVHVSCDKERPRLTWWPYFFAFHILMTSPGSSGVAACRQRTIGLRELVSGYRQFHEGVQWDTEGTQSNNPNKTKIMSSKWLISAKSCKLLYVLVLGGISSTGCSHYTQLWLFIEHIPLSHHMCAYTISAVISTPSLLLNIRGINL